MLCEMCHENKATEQHHLLSQNRIYKRLYGDLIHHPFNIMHICYSCHHDKAVPKQSEIEFCKKLNITPRSKTGLLIWNRLNQ